MTATPLAITITRADKHDANEIVATFAYIFDAAIYIKSTKACRATIKLPSDGRALILWDGDEDVVPGIDCGSDYERIVQIRDIMSARLLC